MVPALQYEGEDHIRGWQVGPEIFGDGLPHDKVVKDYIFDSDVDQRITYMGDPKNANGGQLPGTERACAPMHACTLASMRTRNTRSHPRSPTQV